MRGQSKAEARGHVVRKVLVDQRAGGREDRPAGLRMVHSLTDSTAQQRRHKLDQKDWDKYARWVLVEAHDQH
jgi:hypothetical protein